MPSPDLEAVDDLCRLALAARRLGCTVRLEGATDELRALLELVGMSKLLDEHHDIDLDEGDLR